MRISLTIVLLLLATRVSDGSVILDFEQLGASLAAESHDNDAGGGNFQSRGATLSNEFTDFGGGFSAWRGFSISNRTDSTTSGFGNQYSAWPGSGAGGSATYGVVFDFSGGFARISAPTGMSIDSFWVANTTYAALSMRDGDAFAKQFGGASGNEPDFLRMIITGLDVDEHVLGTQAVYLADFRPPNSADDYIVDDWQQVDVSGLGASQLTFAFQSSDVGPFGINTPTYAAIDQISFSAPVPEPPTVALWMLTLAVFRRVRRRRNV